MVPLVYSVFYLQKTAQFHFQRHFLTGKTLFDFLTPEIIFVTFFGKTYTNDHLGPVYMEAGDPR